ncbi:hypothetical protein PACTADRAFT_50614 [Pachysolen tannophilus NRRL Y-2460]|uniref:Glycerol-3-phosphate dehydrogenase n=1 Tax=Pachysolen tannophilus NRRL Y-2460 TaxID=669874 RepID=A0A1E4TSQ3_PACTA|nr:hypothetical protein PACTADRAFT_50614 [Pachysolen tannophilus NRRL Y-2460]
MSRFPAILGRLLKATALTSVVGGASLASYSYAHDKLENDSAIKDKLPAIIKELPPLPSREALIKRLGPTISEKFGTTKKENEFSASDAQIKYDLIIIGGGATGTGCAVDATTRGLNVLLLEKNDFASGTSSKSTKMAHGGVRYLEKAFWELSKAQLDLVIEALNERSSMLENAPHLSSVLPIMIPVYKWWEVPYMYVGCKAYDFFAGSQNLKSSYILSPSSAIAAAPMLKADNLVSALVYHDGSFNDSRMNVALALTAIKDGATVLNYMEVKQLLKTDDNKVKGVRVVDSETGNEYLVGADAVINATGPKSDTILDMDHDVKGVAPALPLNTPRMVVPSGGVHVMLPDYYCPKDLGLLDPSTSDGRVMFFLPWQGRVLAGTTDTPLKKVPDSPIPSEEEIRDILKELQPYIKFEVKREDVLSAWCGIRPLVKDPRKVPKDGTTQDLVRNHLIHQTDSGLITISGGKWTTYREMAQETIDTVIEKFPELKTNNSKKIALKPCQTKRYKLYGAEFFDRTLAARLAQEYQVPSELAEHLAAYYGDKAGLVLELYKKDEANQLPVGLASDNVKPSYNNFQYPFTVAELKYSIANEYTRHPIDFLARRTRLAMLDAKVGLEAVDGVVKVMGEELNWDNDHKEKVKKETEEFIKYMGIYENTSCFIEDQKH